jgi:hypothetical protein
MPFLFAATIAKYNKIIAVRINAGVRKIKEGHSTDSFNGL